MDSFSFIKPSNNWVFCLIIISGGGNREKSGKRKAIQIHQAKKCKSQNKQVNLFQLAAPTGASGFGAGWAGGLSGGCGSAGGWLVGGVAGGV